MTTDDRTYYRVAVTDGYLINNEGGYLRDVIVDSCGHNHRTRETAEACQVKLRNRHREATGGWVESARWYNSKVLPVSRDGRHKPEPKPEADLTDFV